MSRCDDCFHYGACILNSEYVPTPCSKFENKADVVEVVRCKDCRLRDTEGCPMMVWDVSGVLMGDNEDNDYCNYGERREQ